MKMFDLFIALVKAKMPGYVIGANITNLFDLRAKLLNSATMKKNAALAKKLIEFSNSITPYCCYFSEIEERYWNSEWPFEAEQIMIDLFEWGEDKTNHDVHKLKDFILSKLEQYESVVRPHFCAPVDKWASNMRDLLDEIPSKTYSEHGEDVFKEIIKLLSNPCQEEASWENNIEAIKDSFMSRYHCKLAWVKIKQALRNDCEDLLTPSLFSIYSTPKLKEQLKVLVEGIPSERFASLLKISSMAPIYDVDRVNGLYLSRQSNTMTRRPGQTQVTQSENQISNLSKFCFG